MTNETNTAAIESLRSFALTPDNVPAGDFHSRQAEREHMVEFADMCTSALNGEKWAIDRMAGVIRRADYTHSTDATVLRAILATDTTRPDRDEDGNRIMSAAEIAAREGLNHG